MKSGVEKVVRIFSPSILIEDLTESPRLINRCRKHDIHSLEDLAAYGLYRFKKLPGVGAKTVNEARILLFSHRMRFFDEVAPPSCPVFIFVQSHWVTRILLWLGAIERIGDEDRN